ncbi:unnamed protein product [Mytilus edulis]|uniref:DDE Tnp4 domain-containing protein n=1 Tax=Mytilus edulis TaxID=6550 RepID=A0A8S3PMG9_MYTED|nr:unnamed protein product [Mytilus edulis]
MQNFEKLEIATQTISVDKGMTATPEYVNVETQVGNTKDVKDIGVTPNGMVTFVSRLWGGNVSDRHIVEHDGLIPKLSPGDVIMADKGFTIEDLLSPDIGLNVPPRVSTKHQMSSSEFFKTANIASARIVVEMKMEQVKNFQILNSILPLSEAHLAEQIAIICISWTNLLPPLLQ